MKKLENKTSDEMVIELLVKILDTCEGEVGVISAGNICRLLNESIMYYAGFAKSKKVAPSLLRSYIHTICINKLTRLPLLASHNGYFISGDQKLIQDYIKQLEGRINSITARYVAIATWTLLKAA